MLFLLSAVCFVKQVNYSEYDDLNFYQILGLQKTARDRDIIRSYKRFLVQKKRQTNPTEKTRKLWKQTEMAYNILSNPSSKVLYDKFGTQFLNKTEFSILGYQSEAEYKAMKHIYKDIHQELSPYGGFINYPLQFSLLDFFSGASKTIQAIRIVPCTCPRGGSRCAKCRKNPFVESLVTHKVELPPGAAEYHRIYVNSLGDSELVKGAAEVVFVAYMTPDDRFLREGNDLYINLTIPLEKVIGGEGISLTNIDGEEIKFESGFRHGEVIKVKGAGMPIYNDSKKRGDLLVNIHVDFPKALTEEQKKVIRAVLPDDPEEYK